MDNVQLLDPQIQDGVRQALVDGGFANASTLEAESVIALATIGEHPSAMRAALLPILPVEARAELVGEGLLDYSDGPPVRWSLTPEGRRAAELACAALPQLSPEDTEALQAEYDQELQEAERDLGLRPDEHPPQEQP